MVSLANFENTIAYGTFSNNGGAVTLTASSFIQIPFGARSQISKNISSYSVDKFDIEIEQTGAYYIDFSFIADSGDGKNYTIKPYINSSVAEDSGTQCLISFFQQTTEQKYEVSANYIFDLKKGDKFEVRLSVASLPAVENFEMKDIKMTLVNLQQLGCH